MQSEFEFDTWERSALLELYRESRSVITAKGLKIQPAAIVFFDSATLWGRWDPTTRTISLSRKLVQNHPWFQVLGILRHEMAHQWVDEAAGRGPGGESPHGELFRTACGKVGVPREFCGASADLQECGLDWKADRREEGAEKLLDKVRKLLALATSSNENEALLAMNKVRELYAKYNLEQAAEEKNSGFAHLIITHGRKRIESYQSKVIGILVGHFFVKVLTFKQYDAASGQRHRAIEIIGTRENVLMAEYVYHFLLQQTDFYVEQAVLLRQSPMPLRARNSFRFGILQGFSDKLKRSERVEEGTAVTVSRRGSIRAELSLIGKAVNQFENDDRLNDYLSEIYPRLSRRGARAVSVDDSAYRAGVVLGQKITLNKPVSTSQGYEGRLLPGATR